MAKIKYYMYYENTHDLCKIIITLKILYDKFKKCTERDI